MKPIKAVKKAAEDFKATKKDHDERKKRHDAWIKAGMPGKQFRE